MSRRLACLCCIAALAAALPFDVLADGKAFAGRDYAALRTISQNEQRAAIVHRDDVETMVIAVNLALEDDAKALWLFPVLGSPADVKLEVVPSFPRFAGRNVRENAAEVLATSMLVLRTTQLWPLVFDALLVTAGGDAGVVTHSEAEKWGLHAQTMSAPSVEALGRYLQDKGFGIGTEELAAFDPYLSDTHTLVAVWIKSSAELVAEFPQYRKPNGPDSDPPDRWPCVCVQFPTDRAYYPMYPTSTYGDHKMRVNLAVAGYVNPQDNSGDAVDEPEYYAMDAPPKGASGMFAAALPKGHMAYSRLVLTGEAGNWDEDLWFEPTRPKGIALARALNWLRRTGLILPTVFILVALLSYAAAGLSGLRFFGKWHPYAWLGLWNLATFAALVIVVRHARLEGRYHFGQQRESPMSWLTDFCATFTFLFVVLAIVVQFILHKALHLS
jgi:hypothetical protein